MNDWLSIPTKTRIDLLREYKRNGIGYAQAKKDFLKSYEVGGNIEQPTDPALLQYLATKPQEYTAPPQQVSLNQYQQKQTPEFQQQVSKDLNQQQVSNTINDIGTNLLTQFTQFRTPEQNELEAGRTGWKERAPVIAKAAAYGLINEMAPKLVEEILPKAISKGTQAVKNVISPAKKTPATNKMWYDEFHQGELKNMLPSDYDGKYIERGVNNKAAIDDFFNTGIIRNNKSAGLPLTKRSANYGERVFYGPEGGGMGLPNARGNYVFKIKNSKELTNRPVTFEDVEDILIKQDNGKYTSLPDWKSKVNRNNIKLTKSNIKNTGFEENPINYKKAIAAGRSGEKFVEDWVQHPITMDKFNKGNKEIAQEFITDVPEYFTLNSTGTGLLKNRPRLKFLNNSKVRETLINKTPIYNIEKLENPFVGGAVTPIDNKAYVKIGNYSKPVRVATDASHEVTHQVQNARLISKPNQFIDKPIVFSKREQELLSNPFKTPTTEYEKYVMKPEEVHARFMSIRNNLKLKPGEAFTEEMIPKIEQSAPELLELIKDKKSFIKSINEMWGIVPVAAGIKKLTEKNE